MSHFIQHKHTKHKNECKVELKKQNEQSAMKMKGTKKEMYCELRRALMLSKEKNGSLSIDVYVLWE